ncbi:MAG: hypothetical protein JWR89_4265 [Tardiphaga sp.]|uniref:hypothetical protein n=1 Tax=Tardiphaga sp. TaxID=1926292 RepID=UPI0026231F50|nr:hypothetical protein [Tardiphaga sp.]MDB5504363.1 hypothetical protein [Tardiphaga sp.]
MAVKLHRAMLIGLPAVAAVALAAWMFFPGLSATHSRPTEPAITLSSAVVDDGNDPIEHDAVLAPAVTTPAAAAPLGRLRISRQSFSRGGLGSRALMTFTVRNGNDYAVKDLELLCKFRSRDGRYTTERRRTLNDTVEMKSRKMFPLTHIGFVNVKAAKAKCAVVTAERA